jgi:hypothetical protein
VGIVSSTPIFIVQPINDYSQKPTRFFQEYLSLDAMPAGANLRHPGFPGPIMFYIACHLLALREAVFF